jgi:hypothetical protein
MSSPISGSSPDLEGLGAALDVLARRADLHQSSDRVAAVRRRARRTARSRVAAFAAATAVAGAGVAVQLGAAPFDRGQGPSVTPTSGTPHLDLTVTRSPDPAVTPDPDKAPFPGGITVVLEWRASGLVPQRYQPDGTPIGVATVNDIQVRWGDGDTESGSPDGPGCRDGARLVPIDQRELLTHTFRDAGTYVVTVGVGACTPVGQVSSSLTITVP